MDSFQKGREWWWLLPPEDAEPPEPAGEGEGDDEL